MVPGGRAGLERNVLENPCKNQTQQIISEVNRVNYGWEMDQHKIDAGGYRGGSGRVGLMMCSTRPLETWVESVSQETSTSGSRCGTHPRPPPQEHESRVPPSPSGFLLHSQTLLLHHPTCSWKGIELILGGDLQVRQGERLEDVNGPTVQAHSPDLGSVGVNMVELPFL